MVVALLFAQEQVNHCHPVSLVADFAHNQQVWFVAGGGGEKLNGFSCVCTQQMGSSVASID